MRLFVFGWEIKGSSLLKKIIKGLLLELKTIQYNSRSACQTSTGDKLNLITLEGLKRESFGIMFHSAVAAKSRSQMKNNVWCLPLNIGLQYRFPA